MGTKVKATSVMAKHLNDAFKRKGFEGYSAKCVELDERAYAWYAGNVYDAYDNGDFNYSTARYKVLMVRYPADYYACDKYITTSELRDLFESGDSITTFADRLADECEI